MASWRHSGASGRCSSTRSPWRGATTTWCSTRVCATTTPPGPTPSCTSGASCTRPTTRASAWCPPRAALVPRHLGRLRGLPRRADVRTLWRRRSITCWQSIRRRGPLSTLDFERRQSIDWYWGPTNEVRAALEALAQAGVLGLARREVNRRYYDLVERLFPAELLDHRPGTREQRRHQLLSRYRGGGLLGSERPVRAVAGHGQGPPGPGDPVGPAGASRAARRARVVGRPDAGGGRGRQGHPLRR